jgi:hypothetical protein
MANMAAGGSWVRRARWTAVGAAALAVVGLAGGCVTNAGDFTASMRPNSFLEVLDAGGAPNPASHFDFGTPGCANGIDDDLDGVVDGADGQCDATNDRNERLDGVQAFVAPTLPFHVESDGHFTVQPTALSAPPIERCVRNAATGNAVWCLSVTLKGAGGERQGSIRTDGNRVRLPLPATLKFDAVTGFPGLPATCETDYINGPYAGEGYDEATGNITEQVAHETWPALTTCGSYNATLNTLLGLPAESQSTLNWTLRNASGQTIHQA